MPLSTLDLFRTLSAFDPKRGSLADAPWESYVEWAVPNGLAPLAAYNLEYRLGGSGAPEWARDKLLSVYQGSLNDNVMKLVNLKRALDGFSSGRLLLLGAASYAETLYPHVAFRPVAELHLCAEDLDGLEKHLAQAQFRRDLKERFAHSDRVLSDGRTLIFCYRHPFPQADASLWDRALPAKVYGPSMLRLGFEDSLLWSCFEQAASGYEVPAISWVDIRELLEGATAMSGDALPLDTQALKERARAFKLERALYASTQVVRGFFPQTAALVESAQPNLRRATRALLDRVLVAPLLKVGSIHVLKGSGRIRRLLSGF